MTVGELADALGVERARIAESCDALVREGRATLEAPGEPGGEPRYSVTSCLIPAEDPAGFEAAILDHVQAMTSALCHRLRRRGGPRETVEERLLDGAIGGSTYTFDLAPDNPAWERVTSLLTKMRAELSALRAEADAFEDARAERPRAKTRFTFYCGQNVLAESLAPAALDGSAVPASHRHEEDPE